MLRREKKLKTKLQRIAEKAGRELLLGCSERKRKNAAKSIGEVAQNKADLL